MMLRKLSLLVLTLFAANLVLAEAGSSRFPHPNPDLRAGTPNDPRFDCYESDDEDPGARCADLGSEQYQLFGFAPDATENSAYYKEGPRIGQAMVSGVRADAAWKISTGSPDVVIAIMDTGIRWDNAGVRRKIWLNRNELPIPQGATRHDADGDGAFTVDDYKGDARVSDANGNGLLDGQDLIRAFSNQQDEDGNGYIDDIAGWDFLDMDNDPEDVSSYSSARNHGTGRALEAAEQTNDGAGGAGICPQCRLMMIRPWDTFVYPGDNWAAGTVYAADNGALVQVVANGVLQNTRAAQAANRYAYEKGMALMHVSSDLNTANHNYPTNYVESVFINGCVPDLPAAGGNEFFGDAPGSADLRKFLAALGVNLGADAPIQTWFRQANLTQHGAHAHVCYVGDTGSQATGQAGGGAGLIHSLGIQKFGKSNRLSSNEVKQVMTLSAEDVLPLNTVGIGIPDPAQQGWDEHFGYGRADLGAALRMVQAGRIPPEAQIEFPAWWAMLDPVAENRIAIHGLARASRSSACSYSLQWALGVEPTDDDFETFADNTACSKTGKPERPVGTGSQGKGQGQVRGKGKGLGKSSGNQPVLGELPVSRIADQLPGSRKGKPPEHVNEFVITVRLRVTDADGNVGEDRKTYFVYHDPTWHEGWPKFVDTGGETSPVLYDLDGNGTLEIIEGNSSGELWVWQHDGTTLPSFNGGEPWQLPPTHFYYPGSKAFTSGAVPPLTAGFRTPAVADLDNDGIPEIVAPGADGRIFVLTPEGTVKFQVALDPARSNPKLRTAKYHPKRGILGSVVLADLDQTEEAGRIREIIVGALDGHIYVWSGKDGTPRNGFPRQLIDDLQSVDSWGEIIATPAVGNLDDDPQLEIVSGTNEFYSTAETPTPDQKGFTTVLEQARGLAINVAAQALGGSSRIHAINDDGSAVANWPVQINGLLPDILPLVGPNHAVALADFNGDGRDSVVATITTSDLYVIDADGSKKAYFSEGVVNGIATGNAGGSGPTKILNLFEYPIVGDINGFGGLDIAKGGLSAAGAVNLVVTGQNLPFSHVIQVWDSLLPESFLPGYPASTDDYQLLSTPAIADVNGSGTREVIVGTGMYLIHAYNLYGEDVAGFPKLAGGWLYNVPAIGDIDGDGKLEMVAGTREGWRFVWDLEGADGALANGQWWTEGHDECHTNNYGQDCRPPAAVRNVKRSGNTVRFGATGDDWNVGPGVRYELTRPGSRNPLPATCTAAGAQNIRCILPPGTGDVLIQAIDDAGNRSRPVLAAGGR